MSGGFVNLYLSTLFSVGRSEKHHTTTYMLAVHWTPVNETKKTLYKEVLIELYRHRLRKQLNSTSGQPLSQAQADPSCIAPNPI